MLPGQQQVRCGTLTITTRTTTAATTTTTITDTRRHRTLRGDRAKQYIHREAWAKERGDGAEVICGNRGCRGGVSY